MEKTLVICKPDAVERGLVGEIISRFERKGLAVLASDLRLLDRELLGRHYSEHTEKPFFGDLVAFMSRSPVMLLVVGGPEGPSAWSAPSWGPPTRPRRRREPSVATSVWL